MIYLSNLERKDKHISTLGRTDPFKEEMSHKDLILSR